MLITQVGCTTNAFTLFSRSSVYWTWGSINIHYAEQRNAFNWKIRTKLNLKPALAWKSSFVEFYEPMWQRDNPFGFSANCSPRRDPVAILRPMAVVPQMSLENGTWSSHRWLLGMSAGLQLLSHWGKVVEKENRFAGKRSLITRSVTWGAHQCLHAAGTGIICTSVSTTLCRFKNQQKRFLSCETLTGSMWCSAYLITVWWHFLFEIYKTGSKWPKC